jgi:hypothetical protein
MPVAERQALGEKAQAYVKSEFSYDMVIDRWHNTLNETIKNWKSRRKNWEMVTL